MPECSVKAGDLTAVSGQSAVEALTTGTPSLGIVGCRHFNLMGFTNELSQGFHLSVTMMARSPGTEPSRLSTHFLTSSISLEHPLFCNQFINSHFQLFFHCPFF